MSADPDFFISDSRGPFTDEGLNTIQVRNLVNHGYLSISECDNLLKTPLFALSLYIPFKLFGTHLLVSRWLVLILVLLPLILISFRKNYTSIILIFSLVSLFQYQVFQFAHFSLAEMLSTISIIVALYFYTEYYSGLKKNQSTWYLLMAVLFISASYYFKIQFIYLIILLPLLEAWRRLDPKNGPENHKSETWILAGGIVFFLGLYFFAWYLPYRHEYNYMMEHQSGNLIINSGTWKIILFNLRYHFLEGPIILFSLAFLFSVIAGFRLLKAGPAPAYPLLFKGSFIWLILELHKLPMQYLPTRYLVSLYVAMGFLISVVLAEIISWPSEKRKGSFINLRTLAIILAGLLFILNLNSYRQTFQRRSYNIANANYYLARFDFGDKVVLGAWAPGITWECKARAIPVWDGFLNYGDPLRTFKPALVVSEPDQEDSNQAYIRQGIDLQQDSDSIKSTVIGRWEIYFYWIKGDLNSR